MARIQDYPSITPTSSDKLLVVQSQGQGLVPYGSKLDSANPTGTGSLSLNRKANTTVGSNSVALGRDNEASGSYSTALGRDNKATAYYATAMGASTEASGNYSSSEGLGTIANHQSQKAFGEYNLADGTASPATRGTYIEIVGKGTADNNRSNARTLDWSGNEVLAGDLTIMGNKSLNERLATSGTSTSSATNTVSVGNANLIRITAMRGASMQVDTYEALSNGIVSNVTGNRIINTTYSNGNLSFSAVSGYSYSYCYSVEKFI